MSDHSDLVAKALEWAESDPDPATRAELERLVASSDPADRETLRAAFANPVGFGTAGVRAAIGIGPSHFNVALVTRLAAAIRLWIDAAAIPGPVVLGFDARHLGSTAATHAASMLAASGRKVFIAPHPVPTPLIAFATQHLDAACGVMITASHNPATDNGVKVFGHDGRQIIEPADTEIQSLMASLTPAHLIPAPTTPETLPHDVTERYVESLKRLCTHSTPKQREKLRIAHTSLHGVAHRTASEVLDALGIPAVFIQSTPDPSFPNLPFPNPEEPGVMDDVIALALEHGCDLALANDPDADRLAVAVRTTDGEHPGMRILTGDELGAVLMWWKLTNTAVEELARTHTASTIVSSQLPAAIASLFGSTHHTTLTGFKWLSRVPELAFAYEEAIGYCVDPANVRDKDGLSALVVLCDMVAAGHDPVRVLAHLAETLGHHVQRNISLRIEPDHSAKLRSALLHLTHLGPLEVQTGVDLQTTDTPTTGVKLHLQHPNHTALRLVLRPSGTEPKTKVYVEAVHASRELAEQAADECAAALTELSQLLT